MTRLRLGLAAFAAALVVTGAAPAVGVADDPTVALTPDLAPTGTRVTVELTGWTGASSVVVELCGNAPEPRSSDCDLAGSQGGNVPEDGSAVLDLVIGTPPAPCPCLVRVHAADGTGPVASAPIVITDLAAVPTTTTSEATTSAPRAVAVEDGAESGSDPEPPYGAAAVALVLVAGGGFAVVRRRRRKAQASPIA